MTHLVSLISEHLLPNFLFIKEMTGKYDDLLFIITQDTFIVNLRVAQKGIKSGHIYRGVKVYRDKETTNDNEIDVMRTADNQLFVGECKTTLNLFVLIIPIGVMIKIFQLKSGKNTTLFIRKMCIFAKKL